jgi:hypothetical protein
VSTRLFKTKDRDESHRKLEEVLAGGLHPLAECREDHSQEDPYEVWDGQRDVPATPPPTPSSPATTLVLDQEAMEQLAELVAQLVAQKIQSQR